MITQRQGLTGLLIAKFELDPATQQYNLLTDIKGRVPGELLERMPRFMAIYNKYKQLGDWQNIHIDGEPLRQEKVRFDYHLLEKDRETLNKIHKSIKLYLTQLKNKQKTSKSVYWTKAIVPSLIASLYAILYVCVLIWLLNKVMEDPAFWRGGRRDPQLEKYNVALDLLLPPFIITIPGGWALLWAGLDRGLNALLEEKIMLSPGEWSYLRVLIEDELLDKLLGLEEKEKKDHVNEGGYLPTDREAVHYLDQLVRLLNDRQSVDGAINLFTDLKDHIRKIKTDMNVSNHPVSLFYKPKEEVQREWIINVADETMLDVPFNRPVRNYGGCG